MTDITLKQLAKMIDHALLHPTMTDAEIRAGCEMARKYDVATVCVKPYSIDLCKDILAGSTVSICSVIGFPHGNNTQAIKAVEAGSAMLSGASEIDMVINIGKLLSGDIGYVKQEIRLVNDAVRRHECILKVIFENAYLQEEHIIKLCEICSEVKVAFIKTSTGFDCIKRMNGSYITCGAVDKHIKLMRKHCSLDIQIKASGGIRILDDLLYMQSLGCSRFGTSSTENIIKEAIQRGIS